jgi:hypothetical protein
LLPGFFASSGSQFTATIEDTDNSSSFSMYLINGVEYIDAYNPNISIEEKMSLKKEKDNFTYKVSPNPVNDILTIEYSLQAEIPFSIELMDFLGNRVSNILTKQKQSAGDYIIQMPVSKFVAGMYFIVFSNDKYAKTSKIIINSQ